MPVAVRLKARRRHRLRRLWRRLRAVVGSLLLVIAATTAMLIPLIPALVLTGLVATGERSGPLTDDQRATLGQLGWGWLLAVIVTVSGWTTGLHLLRGRRGTVLWLRRFGYGEATHVVSSALDYIGRSWRVVTLDDAATEAVGVAAGLRIPVRIVSGGRRMFGRLVGTAKPVGRAMARVSYIGIIGVLAWSAYRGGLAALRALADTAPGGSGSPSDSIESQLLWIFVAVLAVVVVVVVAYLVVRIAVIPFTGLVTLGREVVEDVESAEGAKMRTVNTLADLDAAVASIAAANRAVVAPRLTVITVDSAVWRATVTELAEHAAAVIVDVSQVTENVMWEIEEMTRLDTVEEVFVGHAERIRQLADEPQSTGVDTGAVSKVQRLQQLLDRNEVLMYTVGFLGRYRFERALFGELEDTRPRATIGWRALVGMLMPLLGIACFALAMRSAVLLLTDLL